jgi:hypothetical protein
MLDTRRAFIHDVSYSLPMPKAWLFRRFPVTARGTPQVAYVRPTADHMLACWGTSSTFEHMGDGQGGRRPMALIALIVSIAQLIVGGIALGIVIHDRNRK